MTTVEVVQGRDEGNGTGLWSSSWPSQEMRKPGKAFRLKGCARPFFVLLTLFSFLALILLYSVTPEGPNPYNLPAAISHNTVYHGMVKAAHSTRVSPAKVTANKVTLDKVTANKTTLEKVTANKATSGKATPNKVKIQTKIVPKGNHSTVPPLAKPSTTSPRPTLSSKQTTSLRLMKSPKHNGPTKVLVVAYFRSGSTYFSEMFNFNPDAFYLFEPLAYFLLLPNQTVTLLNGSVRTIMAMETNKYIASILDDILNCRLESLPIWYLKHPFLTKSSRFIRYLHCIHPLRRSETHTLSFCVKGLIRMCQASKVRVVKLIRYGISVKGITTLRQNNPDLKVVHLVRDPRGSVLSQFDATVPESAYMAYKRIVGYCDKIEKDLKAIQILNNKTENKILTLNYEDMAENPSTAVSTVYSFLNLKVPLLALHAVRKHSSAKKNDQKFGTARQNSTLTAYAWKPKIKYDMVKTIDTYCSSWYPLVGYLPINSRKELADPNNKHRISHPSVLT